MATIIALKRGTATTATLVRSLFSPIQLRVNTKAAQVSAYDDFNRTIDTDRRSDSSVYRRSDNDFSDPFNPITPTRSLSQIFNMKMKSPFRPFTFTITGGPRRGWDAKEDGKKLSLQIQTVNIFVEQNTLIIEAEVTEESEKDEEPWREVFKQGEIKTERKNGDLRIVLPKLRLVKRKDAFQFQVK